MNLETNRELSGQINHCEKPVVMKSRNITWEGEYEYESIDMVCAVCAAELTLDIKTEVGPPQGSIEYWIVGKDPRDGAGWSSNKYSTPTRPIELALAHLEGFPDMIIMLVSSED